MRNLLLAFAAGAYVASPMPGGGALASTVASKLSQIAGDAYLRPEQDQGQSWVPINGGGASPSPSSYTQAVSKDAVQSTGLCGRARVSSVVKMVALVIAEEASPEQIGNAAKTQACDGESNGQARKGVTVHIGAGRA